MKQSRLAVIALVATVSAISLAQQPISPQSPGVIVADQGTVAFIEQPAQANFNAATGQIVGSTANVNVTMAAPIAIGHDSMVMIVTMRSGRVILSTFGEAELNNLGIGKNSTAFVDSTGSFNIGASVLSSGVRSVNGASVSLSVTSPQVSGDEIIRVETAFADEANVIQFGMSVLVRSSS